MDPASSSRPASTRPEHASALPRSARELARRIDHTLLRPEATAEQIDRLCEEAREYEFCAVCVNPLWVERCVRRLAGTETRVASVAGFPLGASLSQIKAAEARTAVEQGAVEIDMVASIASLVAGEEEVLRRDVAAVVQAVQSVNPAAAVKVILETAVLTDEQMALGCRAAAAGGAAFVKTSTGFHPAGGATAQAVRQLRKYAAPLGLRVKASGGIRDLSAALSMIEAGADRLGTSAGVAIVTAWRGP